jgi:5,10-methylenetetrahydromethanopterin reductase
VEIAISISPQPRPTPSGPDLQPWIDAIRRADELGISRVLTGDIQHRGLECFAALTLMATITRRCRLGPLVTNPVTRDVGVMANAIASVDAISGGRAMLIIARGDSAVQDVGLPAATVEELRDYVLALRELLTVGVTNYHGRTLRAVWPNLWAGVTPRKIPIYVAAEGPRMLRLAGAIGDGVSVGAGLTAEIVQQSIAMIHAGAREAGRDPAELEIWWDSRCSVAPTRAEALNRVRETLSSAGNHALTTAASQASVPPELLPALREYHRRYDYREKNRPGGTNPSIMEELGLTDYFLERFGVVGSPDEVVARLRQLESFGVSRIVLRANANHPDGLELIGQDVLPRLASAG